MSIQTASTNREEKLKHLVNVYGTSLLRMCYAMLNDHSMAEDATQDTFLKAYKNLENFAPRDQFSEKAWLIRIAMNTCSDYRRSAWFRHVDRRYEAEKVIASEQFEEDQKSLLQDVMRLPPQYRDILFLHYYQDLSIDEICTVLNERKATIYKRLERARQKLRVHLERGDMDE